MAAITIGHHPELTIDEAISIFRRRFEPRYNIDELKGASGSKREGDEYEYPMGGGHDFAVRKNAWVAVGVKLTQEADKTKFSFSGTTPSRLAYWVLMGGGFVLALGWLLVVLPMLLLWNGPMNEVKTFIREAPEFQ